MPDLTPNLNLKKPNWETDVADIRVFNDNMDIIDEKITDGNEAIQGLEEKKQNKEDSTLKTIAKKIVEAINELFDSKLEKGGYTGNAKNLNDEISKKASKTVLGRMIVGDNLTVDDNGRVSATKTEIVNDLTTGGAAKAGSAEMVKKLGEDKQNKTDDTLETDSKKIVGAINESLWKIKPKDLFINDGTIDLNTYEVDGFYHRRGLGSSTLINQPKSVGNVYFYLIVFSSAFFTYQLFFDGVSSNQDKLSRTFMRKKKDEYGWSEWQEILTTNSSLFLGNAGITTVKYIQEKAIKEVGKSYTDNVTGKLYYCYKQAPATVVTVDSEYFYPATNNDLAKNMFNVFEEVTVLESTATTQDQNIVINIDNYSKYKYINLYYGSNAINKANVLGAKILIKDISDTLTTSIGLRGYNDSTEYQITKNVLHTIYKTVTSDDIFKYVKLTASYI